MITLNHALPRFLNSLGGRRRPRTKELHTERLELFLSMYGHLETNCLRHQHVDEWLEILESRSYAPASMTGFRESVKAFVNFLIKKQLLLAIGEESPVFGLKTGSKMAKRLKVPSIAHVRAISQTAAHWAYSLDARRVRDAAMWTLSCRCAPRSQEIRKLRLSEIEDGLKRGSNEQGVYLVQSGGKTEETIIRFTEADTFVLKRWLQLRPKTTINRFFTPMRRSTTAKDKQVRWRELSRSSLDSIYVSIAKVSEVPPVRPHAMRHFLGTQLAKRGVDAATIGRILNHADADRGAATAYKFYINTDEGSISEAINLDLISNEVKQMAQLFNIGH